MRHVTGIGIRAPLSELAAFLSGCTRRDEMRRAARLFLDKAVMLCEHREASPQWVLSVDIYSGEVTVWFGVKLGGYELVSGMDEEVVDSLLLHFAEIETPEPSQTRSPLWRRIMGHVDG